MFLLTPKPDFIFKKLLAGDTGVLTDLLNAVLGLPKNEKLKPVVGIHFLDYEMFPDNRPLSELNFIL